MRSLVVGDIHGAYKALLQVLQRADFDHLNDRLIVLGDITDGWPEVKECIDFLMKITNLIFIRGNHDQMTLDWMQTDQRSPVWLSQGGEATITSLGENFLQIHQSFLENSKLYYLLGQKLFVHAGINPNRSVEVQDAYTLLYDRSLFQMAFTHRHDEIPPHLSIYDEIYIGHTPIHRFGYQHPVNSGDVWMMDTGAGWGSVLSTMDINTKQVWVSEPTSELYQGVTGRY